MRILATASKGTGKLVGKEIIKTVNHVNLEMLECNVCLLDLSENRSAGKYT